VIDGVAYLELNRPDMANALNLDTAREPAAGVEPAGTDVSEPFWSPEPERGSGPGETWQGSRLLRRDRGGPNHEVRLPYPGIGFTPDYGLSHLLTRAIGQQRTLTISLVGKPRRRRKQSTGGWSWNCTTIPLCGRPRPGCRPRCRPRACPGRRRPPPAPRPGDVAQRETGLEEARGIAEMVKVEEAQRLIARFVSR
jgi:hypothetical protein